MKFFLQYLKSGKRIGDQGAQGLGSALANYTNLQNLALELYGIGASSLGLALANCTNLSDLTLDLSQLQLVIYFFFNTQKVEIQLVQLVPQNYARLQNCTNLSNLTLDLGTYYEQQNYLIIEQHLQNTQAITIYGYFQARNPQFNASNNEKSIITNVHQTYIKEISHFNNSFQIPKNKEKSIKQVLKFSKD
ncbi:hypothetical protein TTHERM_00672280 (macronuclear) [Tetrahymena thermophila SB210]|uniref:Uncharacterized protein n=1 Tax=Tetrahymena thermophila (strain SB210) TaxID=312017 RepID=Q23E27_TETTS|nr:hypothetical protein TTHERM_00672280 [Tetrahymena thermophila SB210]EAR94760.1 hypothetical protein TTHERM_00672280 [Tetrahymena thermophila SB210]|eukprot:XP_001015005.1 hypothetical protein TTHERM_00672280 [Tetrahymena thermophila SB210]